MGSAIQQFMELIVEQENQLQKRAEVSEPRYSDEYVSELEKAADSLVDQDYLLGLREKRAFVNRALQDPAYLASVLTRVCDETSVSSIGKPGNAVIKKADERLSDPVMARAFGKNYKNQQGFSILDD